jgi:hypothetical protein
MRKPINMALAAATLGIVLSTSLFKNKSKGNTTMNDKSFQKGFKALVQRMQGWLIQTNHAEPQRQAELNEGELLNGIFFILGILSLGSLLLGIISFSRPTARIAQNDISYEHLGVFSYSASTPQGVYDQNMLKSGDPIFPRLTCSIDVNFQYTLIAPASKNISGTYQLTAIIREQVSGWQREVPLQELASFRGTTFATTAALDICKMESLTQSLEEGTDFHPGAYMLLVTPNIKVNGEVSGRDLEDTFNSILSFQYDRIHFYLVKESIKQNRNWYLASRI